MPGYVEDIIPTYSGADIFCSPSYYEGEGLAILEAMSCGLPVVIRDLPVYEDRLFNGKNCLKARNNGEFIEKFQYLITNPKERKRLGINGLHTAKEFDIKVTGRSIYKTYLDLL